MVDFENDIQNVDLFDSGVNLFNADRDDFGYGGSKKEYYPIDITQGLNNNLNDNLLSLHITGQLAA